MSLGCVLPAKYFFFFFWWNRNLFMVICHLIVFGNYLNLEASKLKWKVKVRFDLLEDRQDYRHEKILVKLNLVS